MIKNINLLIGVLLLCSIVAKAQDNSVNNLAYKSPKIQVAIDSIIDKIISISRYGYHANKIALQLEQCTNAELTALTNHYNPLIRVYAFEFLAKRGAANLKWLLNKHFLDKDIFSVGECAVLPQFVNRKFLSLAKPSLSVEQYKSYLKIISQKEAKEEDGLIKPTKIAFKTQAQ